MEPKELCLLWRTVPFMSFFYTKDAPEYKEYKLKEGELDETKHLWHEENNTYGFSHGLGILIMGIGILTFFRHLLSENRFGGGPDWLLS